MTKEESQAAFGFLPLPDLKALLSGQVALGPNQSEADKQWTRNLINHIAEREKRVVGQFENQARCSP